MAKRLKIFMDNIPLYSKDALAYRGKRFDVYGTEVLNKKGKPYRFEAVKHPGAAVVLPLIDAEKVILLRQERYAIGEVLWELPAGILDAGELPEATAARELIEETGYRANHLAHQISFYSSPGTSNEIIHGYIAKDLEFVGQKLEDGENLIVEIVPLERIFSMIQRQEIKDGKTLILLLSYILNEV